MCLARYQHVSCVRQAGGGHVVHWPSLATRSVRRETFRLAAFLCTTRFWAERMMTGSAAFKAAIALSRSPAAIASSTLPTNVRRRDRRALLTAVRRAMTRVAFLAELVLAMPVLVLRR